MCIRGDDRFDEARAVLQRALELDPSFEGAKALLHKVVAAQKARRKEQKKEGKRLQREQDAKDKASKELEKEKARKDRPDEPPREEREDDATIQHRFAKVKDEIARARACGAYDEFLTNDELDQAVREATRLVRQELDRRRQAQRP